MTKALQLLVRYLSFGVLLIILFIASAYSIFGLHEVFVISHPLIAQTLNLGNIESFFERVDYSSDTPKVLMTSGLFTLWTMLSLTWARLRATTFPWLYGSGLAFLVVALIETLFVIECRFSTDGFNVLLTFVYALIIVAVTIVFGLALLVGAVLIDSTRHGNLFGARK